MRNLQNYRLLCELLKFKNHFPVPVYYMIPAPQAESHLQILLYKFIYDARGFDGRKDRSLAANGGGAM